MKKLLIILLTISISFGSIDYLISDSDFTNTLISFKDFTQFVKENMTNCHLTKQQLFFIHYQSKYNGINPIVVLAKMECESGLINNPKGKWRYSWRLNRAMGYGRYIWKKIDGKIYVKYDFFEVQVFMAAQTLRKWFDKYNNSKKIKLGTGEVVKPRNAATYSLYKYTPFYGYHESYGRPSTGNQAFEKVFKNFSIKYFMMKNCKKGDT